MTFCKWIRAISVILTVSLAVSLCSCTGKNTKDKNSILSKDDAEISNNSYLDMQSSESSEISDDTQSGESSEMSDDSQSGESSETSDDTQSGESSETSDDMQSGESSETSDDMQSGESSETSDDTQSGESSETSDDTQSGESSETSDDTQSGESSEMSDDTQNDDDSSKENQTFDDQTPPVTYFSDTGECTYTTVYSPKSNDKISYENSGICLYNTDFRLSKELEEKFLELFSSFENPQSVTVREMNSEFVFSFNPNERIACASAIKAPFSLFVAKAIEQGIVSWDERLIYEEKYDYFVGSGVIQENYDYGTKFSVKRLYELMLYVSDNIAYLMLKDRFGGASKFNDSMNAIGCGDIIDWGNWGKLTSYEMALVWREIYYYTKSNSSYSQKLYTELDRALYNELEKGITGKENLHKSGWSSNGYNDAGLFFDGEQIYSVAIMTGRTELGDSRNKKQLVEIAKLINELMEEYKAYSELKS